MRLFTISLFLYVPASVFAMECTNEYQPYNGRCISQKMADYIACVEASGGNREATSNEQTRTTTGSIPFKAELFVAGELKKILGKAGAGITLDNESENKLVKRIEGSWFKSGMSECYKAFSSIIENQPAPPLNYEQLKEKISREKDIIGEILIDGSHPTGTYIKNEGYRVLIDTSSHAATVEITTLWKGTLFKHKTTFEFSISSKESAHNLRIISDGAYISAKAANLIALEQRLYNYFKQSPL